MEFVAYEVRTFATFVDAYLAGCSSVASSNAVAATRGYPVKGCPRESGEICPPGKRTSGKTSSRPTNCELQSIGICQKRSRHYKQLEDGFCTREASANMNVLQDFDFLLGKI